MADFGLYSGLLRKSNIFETKAQNRQMELQIAQTMDARARTEMERQAEVDAKMQEFFNTMNQLDVLEQDKERLSAEEKKHRLSVLEGIKQYNGDLDKFMLSGGAGILSNYRNNFLQSETVNKAIANKTNYAQWMHAQANGLWVKDVGVDVEYADPETGEVKKERKLVSMDEAYGMFEKGYINSLPFDGAEKDIDVGPEIFQQIFKDPRNPYSQDTEVAPEDVYLWVRQHGGSHDQANAKMQKYIQYTEQGGTTWRYKSGDPMKLELQKAQLRNMNQKYRMNQMSMESSLGKNNVLDLNARIRNGKPNEFIPILPEEQRLWSQQFGFVYDDKTGRYSTSTGNVVYDQRTSNNPNPKEYDLRTFESFTPKRYHKDDKGNVYLELSAIYNADQGWAGHAIGPVTENMFGWTSYNEGAHMNNWKELGNDIYEGTVFLPITDYFSSDYVPAYLNKQTNVRANADFYPTRVGNQERLMQSYNTMDALFNTVGDVFGITDPDLIYQQASGYTSYNPFPQEASSGQYAQNERQQTQQ